MNREESNRRLEVLAAHLDTVDPEKFNYNIWVKTPGNSIYDELEGGWGANLPTWKGAQDLSCGTSACALGHACSIPEFQELGLRLAWTTKEERDAYVTLGEMSPSWDSPFRAAEALFDLSRAEAEYLFSPSDPEDSGVDEEKATPKEVAKKIRNFVEGRD